jgi:large subunit ribosomal protein L22
MEIKAKAKHIKISPRKVRIVVDIIRGLKTGEALRQLGVANKKAVNPLSKLVDSAIANAVNNFELDKDNLYIKEIIVNEGPTLKRWMPRARGRATTIRKRTSHIGLVLGEVADSGKVKAKIREIEAPVKLGSQKTKKKDTSAKSAQAKKQESKKAAEKISEDVKTPETADHKKVIDPRGEGKGKHTKIEGSNQKGLVNKIFRRKVG